MVRWYNCRYAAVALLGAPDKVNYSAVMLETGVDGAGTLLLEYPDAIATLVVSKMSHGFNHSEFQTENGCIRVDHIGELNEVRCLLWHGTACLDPCTFLLQRSGRREQACGFGERGGDSCWVPCPAAGQPPDLFVG